MEKMGGFADMNHMKALIHNTDGDRGASLVEYGLIVAVISLLSLSAVTLVGDKTAATFDNVTEALEGGQDGGPVGTDPDDDTGGPGGGEETTTTTTTPVEATTTTPVETTTTTTTPVEATTTTTVPVEEEEEAPPGSTALPRATASAFTWWNATRDGGNGEWVASVSYANDWIRHQYLKLEVTEIDDKGKKTTTTVNSFYVPAGGSTTFAHWANDLKDSDGKITGVVEVQVRVISITTADEGWKPVTYPQSDGPVSTVDAPKIP
jgi:Flp pilus assembly pilin Flp